MRKLIAAMLLPIALSGCLGGGASPSPTPATTYAVATGAGDLILRIDTGGGLVPMGYIQTHIPGFSLYGDGRIVVPGPVAEIYPYPLLPNLRVMRITPDEIQSIVRSADAAGLMGPDASYPGTGIFDAGTTVFTLTVGGATHRIDAYALMADVKGENAASDEARARLMRFWNMMTDLNSTLGREVSDTEAYEPAGLRLFLRKADASPDPATMWPLATDPWSSGEATKVPDVVCVLLTGSDMDAFVAVAKSATTETTWMARTNRFSIGVRPLLPDESSCAG